MSDNLNKTLRYFFIILNLSSIFVDAAPAVMQPPPALPTPGNVEIRKYDPKVAQAVKKKPEPEEYLVSPITGEKIPASKVQEHMRIGLLDPRWVDERDKQITARAAEEQVHTLNVIF